MRRAQARLRAVRRVGPASKVSNGADSHTKRSLDVHKFSIVAATLPPAGGQPKVERIETTEKAIRRFIDRLGGGEGLAVCYEAGPGGFALWRLLTGMGVACVMWSRRR